MSFCHEETAEAVERRAVGVSGEDLFIQRAQQRARNRPTSTRCLLAIGIDVNLPVHYTIPSRSFEAKGVCVKMKDFAGTKDREAIVECTAIGPTGTTFVNPADDPRNQK